MPKDLLAARPSGTVQTKTTAQISLLRCRLLLHTAQRLTISLVFREWLCMGDSKGTSASEAPSPDQLLSDM